MSVDITAEDGRATCFSNVGWWLILRFASAYGWTPAATEPPSDHDGPWDGNYSLAAGQAMGPADATALAEALERGLHDPARDDVSQRVAQEFAQDAGTEAVRPLSFDKRTAQDLRELMAICRSGRVILS